MQLKSWHRVELVLLQLSTGEPHPAAVQSRISILRVQFTGFIPASSIEIVGDTIALVVSWPQLVPGDDPRDDSDTLHVFDWKSSALKLVSDSNHVTRNRSR